MQPRWYERKAERFLGFAGISAAPFCLCRIVATNLLALLVKPTGAAWTGDTDGAAIMAPESTGEV
ncbi:hypothetical protein DEJ43_37330 [Streptomyces venezuelae ATCC 10712]|nr:hypothetical protein vnz_36740 [Streptomyces venezuelae]QES03359.1 hypothetical protein DEJ43_37330 [Streptomyces venezuelae ATCC 10712]